MFAYAPSVKINRKVTKWLPLCLHISVDALALRAYNAVVKAIKINDYRGTSLYRYGKWTVTVTRKTVSERAGCGYRNTTTVTGWRAHALNKLDPLSSPSLEGYGGIRNATKKLSTLI